MPVGQHQVLAAVAVEVGEDDAEGQRPARRGRDAVEDGVVGEAAAARRHEQAARLVGEVPHRDRERFVVAQVRGVAAHRPGGGAVAVEGHAARGAVLGEPAGAVVEEEQVLHRVVGDEQVQVAVGVHVLDHECQRLAERRAGRGIAHRQATLGRAVGEPAVGAALEVGEVGAGEARGRPVRPADAAQGVAHGEVDGRRPLHVPADHGVEVAVAVEVGEGRGGGPARHGIQAGLRGRVAPACARVRGAVRPEEPHAADARHQDLRARVRAGHGEREPHRLPRRLEAGADGPAEARRAVARVVEEHRGALPARRPRRRVRPCVAVGKQEVEVAVAVHVPDRDAAAHRLRQEPTAVGAARAPEVDAPRPGHVLERELGGRRDGRGGRRRPLRQRCDRRGHGHGPRPEHPRGDAGAHHRHERERAPQRHADHAVVALRVRGVPARWRAAGIRHWPAPAPTRSARRDSGRPGAPGRCRSKIAEGSAAWFAAGSRLRAAVTARSRALSSGRKRS